MLAAMNWTNKHRHRPWGRYHHGNLKEALLKAARDLVAEFGPQGFSLAEAARRAGVSAAAPYRHFPDRQALMGELALQGFAKLDTLLHEAWNDGLPDPATAFLRMGNSYIAFAANDPASYVAMFQDGTTPGQPPELRQAAERAFGIFVGAASRLGGRKFDGGPADPRRLALHIWALAHGIATLCRQGGRGGLLSANEAGAIFEAGAVTYLAGLQVRIGAHPRAGV
jgi:AcrR family transcriptional regulator